MNRLLLPSARTLLRSGRVGPAGGLSQALRALRRDFPQCRTFADFKIVIPALGDSITEATILEVTKAVGDAVDMDEVIAVVETDKVTVDIYSPEAGKVTEILAQAETDVVIGEHFMTLELGAEGNRSSPPPSSSPAPLAPAPASSPSPATTSPVSPAAASSPPDRQPMIEFRHGKRDSPPPTPSPSKPEAVPSPVSVVVSVLPARYQPSTMSAYEMELIDMGGAEPY